jgi:hypothetical protein
MLARIAAINFQAGQYFFRQTTLERYIADYIENLPEHLSESDDETDLVESDSGTILRAIEAQHGLFVERAKGIYSFSHLTFQEYFTARYIIDNATRGTLAHLVEAHLTEDRWREVFILVSELLENADHFFGLIREKIKRIDVPEEIAKCVAMILDNARQKRGKKGLPLSTSYYISVALTYIFKTAQSHVPESSDRSAKLDLCIRLLGSIYKTHFETNVFDGAPFLNSLLDLDETTSQNQIKIHDSIRRIATGDVALPIEYLRANIRLVECLQTDCYLSRKLRSSLLTTLFT